MKNSTSSQSGNNIVVLDGSPLGAQTTKGFVSIEEAEDYIVERIKAHTLNERLPRLERAIADRIVSEDGTKATSEVIQGKLVFLQELAKAFAPSRVAVTSPRRYQDDEANEE